jgi:signal transduction histidine kinase
MSGICNMRARIEKMGGRFELTSDPKRGTAVVLQMPLNEKP